MGGPTGLDYTAIAAVASAMRIRLTPQRFEGLRVMEAEALKVMAQQAAKNKKP